MADSGQIVTNTSMQVKPKYLEDAQKDLLANIYDVNPRYDLPETLQRRENYDPEGGLSEFFYTDVDGNELDYALPEGVTFDNVTGAFDVPQDISGIATESVLEGVLKPAVAALTPLQQKAIQMGAEGIGSYQQYLDDAEGSFGEGLDALRTSLGAYDPQSYKEYMDPYTQEVIDSTYADLDRQGLVDLANLGSNAVGAGAFGGSRDAIARAMYGRDVRDQKAEYGSKMRSDAYRTAQKQAQSAFENQMNRNQTAAGVFQNLGTSQGALGSSQQSLDFNDQANLLGLGGLEQAQQQSEYDVAREGQIEANLEPFTRYGYMSDVIQGMPSGQSAINTGGAPAQNTIGNTVAAAAGLNSLGNLK